MNRLKYLSHGVLLVICVFVFSGITYAYKSYSIGDEVTYNDIKFYVIKDSSSDEDSIILLKEKLLTVGEINKYGKIDAEHNYINRYTDESQGTAKNMHGYIEEGHTVDEYAGGVAYYTSETCGFINGSWVTSGCTSDYRESDVKHIVDAWASNELNLEDLVSDSDGYKVRLLTHSDLENLGYEKNDFGQYIGSGIYNWVNIAYYWSKISSGNGRVYYFLGHNNLYSLEVVAKAGVRPVINLKKSAIEKEEMIIDDNTEKNNTKQNENKNITNERKDIVDIVKVPNTMQKVSIVFILLGVTLVSISTIILIHNRNKIKK